MMDAHAKSLQRELRLRKQALEQERLSYGEVFAERVAETAARRPSRARARLRRMLKENGRSGQLAKPREPKVYGVRARQLKAEAESIIVEALLEQTDRIARDGAQVVLEEIRGRCYAGHSESDTQAVMAFLHEFIDVYAARLAVKQKRSAAPQDADAWSDVALRAEIERRIELVKAGLLEMKQSRAKSDNLQTLCDGDCGRLACLERICFSNHMASAKDFLWFLDIACNEAAAPAGVRDGAAYCEGWRSDCDGLRTKTKARLVV